MPIHQAREIVPMAALMMVPGASSLLAGFLNLHGTAVPVIRMDTASGRVPPGLNARIIILFQEDQLLGLLVDAVVEIADATEESLKGHNSGYSFNQCVSWVIQVKGRSIPVLSSERLILVQEQQRIAEFQTLAQSRISELSGMP